MKLTDIFLLTEYNNIAIFLVIGLPQTKIIFYLDDGHAPVIDWLKELRRENKRAYAKCKVRIDRLAECGHELRRPEADYLQDGIYELRAALGHVNYRILYFFHGQNVAVLDHALTKEGEISKAGLARAITRKKAFEHAPQWHTYEEDIGDG